MSVLQELKSDVRKALEEGISDAIKILKKYLRWFPQLFLEKPTDKKASLEKAVWKLVERDSIEPIRYIENYPEGKFSDLARKKLNASKASSNQ